MSKVTYGIVEEKYTLGDESRTSFGIAAYADVSSNGTATIVASVNDITDDKNMLLEFLENCNELGLALAHLTDAVEDFLIG